MASCDRRSARWLFALLIGALIALVSPRIALALDPLDLDPATPAEGVRVPMEVLLDEERSLDVAEVEARAEGFRQVGDATNVGYTRAAHWCRFELRNVGDARGTFVVQAFRWTEVTLFDRPGGGPLRARSAGMHLPWSAREVEHLDPAFSVELAPGETRRFHARIASEEAHDLALRVWSPAALATLAAREDAATAAYFGLTTGLILYNLFLFVGTGDRTYRWYVVFQTAYALMQGTFDGLAVRWLFPEAPWRSYVCEFVFAAAMVAAGALFTRDFLGAERLGPRATRLLGWIARGGVALGAAGFVTLHHVVRAVGFGFVMCSLFVFVALGVREGLRRNPNARYFLLAWGALVVFSVADAATTYGLLPRTAFPTLWLRVGASLEALLLSFGLAARFNLLRREKEAAVAQREQAHRDRFAALSRLVSGVAHEIANPLNFSVGGAAALRRHLGPPSEGSEPSAPQRALALVEAGNKRIASVLGNLRAYLRDDDAPRVEVAVDEEVREALALSAEALSRSGVRLETDLRSGARARFVAGELGQVVTNLVVNAAEAMPGGGTLCVRSRVAGPWVEIEVEDDGPGVPEPLRGRVFEPFVTTREAGVGRGLGLAVSHEILTRHGGEIALVPTARGATFRVRLPSQQAEALPVTPA